MSRPEGNLGIDVKSASAILIGIRGSAAGLDFSIPSDVLMRDPGVCVEAKSIRRRVDAEAAIIKGNLARTASLIDRIAPAAFSEINVFFKSDTANQEEAELGQVRAILFTHEEIEDNEVVNQRYYIDPLGVIRQPDRIINRENFDVIPLWRADAEVNSLQYRELEPLAYEALANSLSRVTFFQEASGISG